MTTTMRAEVWVDGYGVRWAAVPTTGDKNRDIQRARRALRVVRVILANVTPAETIYREA
jgi:hypothetical protein